MPDFIMCGVFMVKYNGIICLPFIIFAYQHVKTGDIDIVFAAKTDWWCGGTLRAADPSSPWYLHIWHFGRYMPCCLRCIAHKNFIPFIFQFANSNDCLLFGWLQFMSMPRLGKHTMRNGKWKIWHNLLSATQKLIYLFGSVILWAFCVNGAPHETPLLCQMIF